VANKTPDEMCEKLLNNGFFVGAERADISELAGMKVSCLYSITGAMNMKGEIIEDGGFGTHGLIPFQIQNDILHSLQTSLQGRKAAFCP